MAAIWTTWALFRYSIRYLTVRSHEGSKPNEGSNFLIALKFNRRLGRSAAEVPGKFQSDAAIQTTNRTASSLHEILR